MNKTTNTYTITRKRTKSTILLINKEWVDNFQVKDNTEPALLSMDDIKPFTDDEGNVYEVEIRGTRHYKSCYFLADDIASCFGIKNLEKNLQRPTRERYIDGVHYRLFCPEKIHWIQTRQKNANSCPEKIHCPLDGQKNNRLFLTYKGLMNVLFSSKTPAALKFIDWACELVFTAHMGTENQKLTLAADLIGLTKDQVKQFFDTCTTVISGLYLIDLGTVKDLRKTFNIPDSYPDHMHVYKFGRSNNIAKRFQQHVRTYAKLKIYDITLVYYCPIDSELIAKAETELREHFEAYDMKLDNSDHTEIAIFDAKGKKIKGVFEQLFKIHMTTNISLINKLKDARMEIQVLNDKLDVSEKNNDTMQESYERERQATEEKIKTMQEYNELKIKSLQSKIRRRDKKIASLSC